MKLPHSLSLSADAAGPRLGLEVVIGASGSCRVMELVVVATNAVVSVEV